MADADNRFANPWRFTGSHVAFENPWMKVEVLEGFNPAGAGATYGVMRFRRIGVGAFPVFADGRVALVGQWRVPLGRYSWEMPEGGAEPGEGLEACAARELEEEAGLIAGRLREILQIDVSNSLTDETAVCFLATDLAPGRFAPEDTEVLAQRQIHFLDLLDEIFAGAVRDSLTVAAALRVHHMAVTGALEPALARALLSK